MVPRKTLLALSGSTNSISAPPMDALVERYDQVAPPSMLLAMPFCPLLAHRVSAEAGGAPGFAAVLADEQAGGDVAAQAVIERLRVDVAEDDRAVRGVEARVGALPRPLPGAGGVVGDEEAAHAGDEE